MKMRILKTSISFLLCLALMMCILLFHASLYTRVKLLTPGFFLDNYEKYDLYSYIKTSTENNLTDLSLYTHLPESIFEGLVDESWIKTQVDNAATSIVDYLAYKTESIPVINADEQAKHFKENLDSFIKDENITVDERAGKELESVESDTALIIKNNISILDLDKLVKSSSFQGVRKGLYLLYSNIIIIPIGIFIFAALIFIIHRKDISSFISWAAYSLIASGVMLLIPSIAGIASNFIDNIAISEESIKNIIVSMVNDTLSFFSICGGISAGAGILIITSQFVFERIRKKTTIQSPAQQVEIEPGI